MHEENGVILEVLRHDHKIHAPRFHENEGTRLRKLSKGERIRSTDFKQMNRAVIKFELEASGWTTKVVREGKGMMFECRELVSTKKPQWQ